MPKNIIEAYNIPYSGYVVINSDNQYISKEFKTAKTGRELWTYDIRQAAVWKPELESDAYKMRQWCFNVYETDDFYVKLMMSLINNKFLNIFQNYLKLMNNLY